MRMGNNYYRYLNEEVIDTMATKMGQIPIKKILLNSQTARHDGEYEFIIDCKSVYFNALYDNEGHLQYIDQYFYTDDHSQDDMDMAADGQELLSVDQNDFPVKSYLLSKMTKGNEWLRFHAIVPNAVDADYFHQKYLGE